MLEARPVTTNDSALPATVLQFTVENTGSVRADVELAGWLENAVCLHTAVPGEGLHVNREEEQG